MKSKYRIFNKILLDSKVTNFGGLKGFCGTAKAYYVEAVINTEGRYENEFHLIEKV